MLTKRLALVGIAVLVALGAVFANRGILDSYQLSQKLFAEEELSKRLARENDNIRLKLHLLKTDPRYMEMLARNELGMVSKGEVVVHFVSASHN